MSARHVRLKLYLDENFPVPVGKFLRSEHQSVAFIKNKDKEKSDEEQIKITTKEKRILISLDNDFKVNDNLSGLIKKSSGVILINSSLPNTVNIVKIFKKHLNSLSSIEIKGKVCRISIDKIEIE